MAFLSSSCCVSGDPSVRLFALFPYHGRLYAAGNQVSSLLFNRKLSRVLPRLACMSACMRVRIVPNRSCHRAQGREVRPAIPGEDRRHGNLNGGVYCLDPAVSSVEWSWAGGQRGVSQVLAVGETVILLTPPFHPY